MGILLPPVPQATATTLTHHHRNRSLDSALQRIPEVDVTPSPECENPTPVTKTTSSAQCKGRKDREREDLASLGSDDSGILCGSDSGSSDATNAATRESSVDHLHSRESLDSSVSQPGDMYSVDAVDGAENSDVSVSVSVSVSMPVSPVELSTRLVEEPSQSLKDKVADKNDCSRRDDVNAGERCSQESRPNIARERDDSHRDYQQQERTTEIATAVYHHSDITMQTLPTMTADNTQSELAGAAMTLCCGAAAQQEAETVKKQQPDVVRRQQETKQPKPSEGCLLRLFESQIFDMSMAISYLFNSKEPGVQSYLGIDLSKERKEA